MPKAGIHGARSTNWNSAELESNPIQIASVTAKAATEKASAIQRMSAFRRPSALPTSSSKMAPASGNAQESVSILINSQPPTTNSQSAPMSWELGVGNWEFQLVHRHR